MTYTTAFETAVVPAGRGKLMVRVDGEIIRDNKGEAVWFSTYESAERAKEAALKRLAKGRPVNKWNEFEAR